MVKEKYIIIRPNMAFDQGPRSKVKSGRADN